MHLNTPATDKIPLPKLTAKNKKYVNEIINLVDKILESKSQDPNANTAPLESKINDLIYKLYALDSSEIKLIES